MKARLITVLMVAAALTAGIFVAGCDDDDSNVGSGLNSSTNNGSNNHTTLSAQDFADLYVHAVCEKELECCTNGIRPTSGSTDPITTTQDCENDLERLRTSILNTFTDPKVIYDDEQASDCLNALSSRLDSMQCTDPLTPYGELPECKNVAQGTVKEGEECYADYECKNGMHCVNEVCTQPKTVGEACSNSMECESYYCNEGKCIELGNNYSPITDACYPTEEQ